jgi:hypothetical protein
MSYAAGAWTLASSAAVCLVAAPLLAAEVITVEGYGCPFSFEITGARSLYQGSTTADFGFTVHWQWPGVVVFGHCSKRADRQLRALDKTWCHIEPDPPHRELCMDSRRWEGAETFTTASGPFSTDDAAIRYIAIDASGWMLRLTARGLPPLKHGTDEYEKTLEAMKRLVTSVRWTGP